MSMDNQGFLRGDLKCKVCGKELNHNSKPYILRDFSNGLKLWSFPPHAPSWSRYRETFYGMEGCSKCDGQGRIMVYRSFTKGGDYPKQCEDCFKVYLDYKEGE